MASVQWMMKSIQCHQTTEWGHDEVYYLAPSNFVTTQAGLTTQVLPVTPPGPDAARGGNAGGPGGAANTAWDCNDSGPDSLLTFGGVGVGLFNLPLNPGDRVTAALTMMESDSWSYSDVTDAGAKVAQGVLVATGNSTAAAIVGAVASVIDQLKSLLTNKDDLLGVLTVVLEADANGTVWLADQGAYATAGGQAWISSTASNNQPAEFTARTQHDGGIYDWTVALAGAYMPNNPMNQVARGARDVQAWRAREAAVIA